ncbi:type II secretion system protein GspM [Zhongshania borealis]|uniref:Type II secretion system protein M n=1 Tax=Zhongshania borealis TaxID=889488 RepID=A0ABP7X8A4_9GAMM
MSTFQEEWTHLRSQLVAKIKMVYSIPAARLCLALLLIASAVLMAVQAYSQYQLALQEYRDAKQSLLWFEKAKPLLATPQVEERAQTGESLLSVVTAAAKSESMIVERADYQGEQLVLSFGEAEFERAVTLLNRLEADYQLLNENIAMNVGSAPGLCRLRAVLRWRD